MKIAGEFSFNGGKEEVTKRYADLLEEITRAIEAVDSSRCKVKESKEKTMPGEMLYSPVALIRRLQGNPLPETLGVHPCLM